MPLTITLISAASLAFINIWLAVRVMVVRYRGQISIGHGGDSLAETRMRAHANFTEYVPIALILMGLIELQGGNGTLLWAIGVALVVSRILHPFGMERPVPNVFRAGGFLLTLGATLVLAAWAALIVFQAQPRGKPEPVYFGMSATPLTGEEGARTALLLPSPLSPTGV